MGKHGTEYPRVARDHYPTLPAWPIAALAEHIELRGKIVWEIASGKGHMVRSLQAEGATVYASDIHDYGLGQDSVFDFLSPGEPAGLPPCHMMATNPPFGIQGRTAVRFIERGLERLPKFETLALLLPSDFDFGVTRRRLFDDCPNFVGKIALRRRIKWFENGSKHGPKENSAWYLWSRVQKNMPPIILYGPNGRAR